MQKLEIKQSSNISSRRIALAKRLMKLIPNAPSELDNSLNEVFRHQRFLNAAPEEKRRIMLDSSEWRYRYEAQMPFFETYFPRFDIAPYLTDKHILDFGCFTGGRGVGWAEKYGIGKLYGTDINPIYLEAATLFAENRGIACEYKIIDEQGRIPFPDNLVDTIVTFDVLEHVDDLERTLKECIRVLKPNGVIFAVFPSFYNPLESHLDLVTRSPALQWLFTPEVLTEAYSDILKERGEAANWYAPRDISAWERLPTLNGTTTRKFYALLKDLPLEVIHTTRTPILVTGKKFAAFRRALVRPVFNLILSAKIADDLLLDRIAVVLRRR